MILQDFHTHTTYCDGKNSPEEMVLAAIERGMEKLGLSCHSYTDFDTSYCIKKEKIADYQAEIRSLAEKYKDKIQVFCGVEQDYFSDCTTEGFDYVIGSVHYVKKDGLYLAIDISEEMFVDHVKKHYGGDFIALCEDYFAIIGDVAKKTNASIIGHFDLVSKFNEGDKLFDSSNERYIDAAKKAVDKILESGKVFEINTGAITRGLRTQAYPDKRIMDYIKEKGGKFILSSDSHSTESLCAYFGDYKSFI